MSSRGSLSPKKSPSKRGASTPKNNKKLPSCITPCSIKIQRLNLNDLKNAAYNNDCLATPKINVELSMELKKAINERNILTTKTKKRVFQALDDIKKTSDRESQEYKKNKCLEEIFSSEVNFVKQLETVKQYFMAPIESKNLLDSKDFDILFSNLDSIFNINTELLKNLETSRDTKRTANAFYKIAPFFKLYSVYACDFKKALSFLSNLSILSPKCAKFIENQESRPEVQNKLSALLIGPIQRVPRYKLLLTQLFQLTSEKEAGYSLLRESLKKIEESADHINRLVEEHENMQRLLELQRCLQGSEPTIITPGRILRKEGVLKRVSMKKSYSDKLFTVLMSDIIMFNKIKKAAPKLTLKCDLILPLNKCRIVEMLDKGSFRIICQKEEIVLFHDELSETRAWLKDIQNAIDQVINDRSTLKKESSSRRPVKRKDVQEYHEAGLSPGRPLKKKKFFTFSDEAEDSSRLKLSSRRSIHSTASTSTFSDFQPRSSAVSPSNTALEVYEERSNSDTSMLNNIFGGVTSTFRRIFGFNANNN